MVLDFIGANAWIIIYVMIATIFVGAFFWALDVLTSVYHKLRRRFMRTFVWGPERRRSQEMVRRARAHGPVAVRNRLSTGMVGVCSYKEYKNVRNEREDRAVAEQDLELASRLFMDNSMIVPQKVYTFVDKFFKLWFHTGTKSEGELMLEQLVFEITGFRKDQVDPKGYREAVSLLVVDDARLFVPFYRELSWLSFAEQFKRFTGTNVADATKALLEDIRNP